MIQQNCSKTAAKLQQNCSKTAAKLQQNCSKTAAKLQQNRNNINIIRRIYHILPVSIRGKIELGSKINYVTKHVKYALGLSIKKPHDEIQFEVYLTEHCNLNCAGCAVFAPIAKPEFLKLEEFKKDLTRLGELFSHKCKYIQLLGGEPLLHPEIISFLKITRENFTSGEISLVTNGILLPRQPDEFWQTCADNDISIIVSCYPVNIDRDKIKELSKKFNVNIIWRVVGDPETRRAGIVAFFIRTIDLSGKQDYKKNFNKCPVANGCIGLQHGHLFACSYAPHFHHFNKKFSTNIELTPADSIDIYDENIDRDYILKWLATPTPICKYCPQTKLDTWGEYHINWRPSKDPEEEYTLRVHPEKINSVENFK